jgi:hypothetical protein
MDEVVFTRPNNDVINQALAESQHPVLQQFKNKIAELELTIESLNDELQVKRVELSAKSELVSNANRRYTDYIERVKNVLVETAEFADTDNDTIVTIANNLDIDLNTEAIVDFSIIIRTNVTIPFGKTIDDMSSELESDLDISVSGYEYIQDGWVEEIYSVTEVS